MTTSDFDFLIGFALERAEALPLQQRIRVYRGAAVAVGDDVKAQQLRDFAADLEAADLRCREFAFQFNQRSPVPFGGQDSSPTSVHAGGAR